jgi:hypothetical protein
MWRTSARPIQLSAVDENGRLRSDVDSRPLVLLAPGRRRHPRRRRWRSASSNYTASLSRRKSEGYVRYRGKVRARLMKNYWPSVTTMFQANSPVRRPSALPAACLAQSAWSRVHDCGTSSTSRESRSACSRTFTVVAHDRAIQPFRVSRASVVSHSDRSRFSCSS